MNRQQALREIAYRMWEQAGRPTGRDLEFWLKAEALHGLPETGRPRSGPRSRTRSRRGHPETGVVFIRRHGGRERQMVEPGQVPIVGLTRQAQSSQRFR
jgi:hypothetical protein